MLQRNRSPENYNKNNLSDWRSHAFSGQYIVCFKYTCICISNASYIYEEWEKEIGGGGVPKRTWSSSKVVSLDPNYWLNIFWIQKRIRPFLSSSTGIDILHGYIVIDIWEKVYTVIMNGMLIGQVDTVNVLTLGKIYNF